MKTEAEKKGLPLNVKLAAGRILKMMSRKHQEGDEATFYKCRDIIMANAPALADFSPNWAADRFKGAQGD